METADFWVLDKSTLIALFLKCTAFCVSRGAQNQGREAFLPYLARVQKALMVGLGPIYQIRCVVANALGEIWSSLEIPPS